MVTGPSPTQTNVVLKQLAPLCQLCEHSASVELKHCGIPSTHSTQAPCGGGKVVLVDVVVEPGGGSSGCS